jgi:hypothetical protein
MIAKMLPRYFSHEMSLPAFFLPPFFSPGRGYRIFLPEIEGDLK